MGGKQEGREEKYSSGTEFREFIEFAIFVRAPRRSSAADKQVLIGI